MVQPGIRKGRSPQDGYDRGWGLEFGSMREVVDADPSWQAALAIASGRTVITADRLRNLFLIVTRYLPRIAQGHIIEFGAYRCGSAFFMASLAKQHLPGAKVFALDTFEGMPETDKGVDAHGAGDFVADLNEIAAERDRVGLDNLALVKGKFEDTAPALLRDVGRIALAHIDCDIYTSVAFSYDVVKPHMVPGGYYVFDDSTTPSCIGATEAVEEHVVRRDGVLSEQIWPHHVFRAGL
jgi:hypothetical protein